jgi:hypothetical protein
LIFGTHVQHVKTIAILGSLKDIILFIAEFIMFMFQYINLCEFCIFQAMKILSKKKLVRKAGFFSSKYNWVEMYALYDRFATYFMLTRTHQRIKNNNNNRFYGISIVLKIK